MKRHLLILISMTSLLWAAEPMTVTKENAATFYREFKCLTPEPRYVAPLTAGLCLMPSKKTLDQEKATTGPHTRVYVNYYANPSAVNALASHAAELPAGAVIVKEKLGGDNRAADIAGMIKRPKGYDPANGDWEFFYYSPGGSFTTGKLANCIDCHNNAERDHLFTVWPERSK